MSEVKRYALEINQDTDPLVEADGGWLCRYDDYNALEQRWFAEKSRADEWERDFGTLCKERDALKVTCEKCPVQQALDAWEKRGEG